MDENLIKLKNKTPREYLLLVVLIVSLVIAVFIVSWSKTPNFRPLIQDMRLVDAVKIVDVLEIEDIPYKADIKNHILYVSEAHSQQSRLALAKMGIIIEYPNQLSYTSLPKACLLLDLQIENKQVQPIWEQSWFIKVIRLALGALVIIVLILAVVRPALSSLIYPEKKDLE